MRVVKAIGGTGQSRSDRVKGSQATIISTCAMHRSGIGGFLCIISQIWYSIFEKRLQAVPLTVGIRRCRVRRHGSGGNEKPKSAYSLFADQINR